jgi:hypothetical protein
LWFETPHCHPHQAPATPSEIVQAVERALRASGDIVDLRAYSSFCELRADVLRGAGARV